MKDSSAIFADDSQTALEWCAVLESQNIDFLLRRADDEDSGEWMFEIPAVSLPYAEREIRAYESERAFFAEFRRRNEARPEPLRLKPSLPVAVFAAILAGFHLVTGASSGDSIWFERGALSTADGNFSQWWRPLTALTLHADAPHILGNAVFAVFFGGMLALEVGGGVVLFLSILAGVLGNITSLLFNYGRGYSAVGFSTAIFGILGVMAALRTRSGESSEERFSLRYWLPLGAAVALLGMTGSGPGSDLTGHFFGFFWGCVIGWFSTGLAKHRENVAVQTFLCLSACAAILAAWGASGI